MPRKSRREQTSAWFVFCFVSAFQHSSSFSRRRVVAEKWLLSLSRTYTRSFKLGKPLVALVRTPEATMAFIQWVETVNKPARDIEAIE